MREEDWNICMAMPGKEMVKILTSEYNVLEIKDRIDKGLISLEEINQRIEKSNDGPFIFIMMISIEGIDLLKCAHNLIKTEELELMFKAAKFVANGNYDNKELVIRELTKGFIKAHSPYYLYYMARDVKGAPISFIRKALKQKSNRDVDFYFIRDIKDENIDDFKNNAIDRALSGDIRAILQMVPYVDNDNIFTLVDAIGKLKVDEEYTTYVYLLACKLYPRFQCLEEEFSGITGLVMERLAEFVMKTLDYQMMHRFIIEFPEAPYKRLMDKMLEVILRKGESGALNRFAQIAALGNASSRYAVHKIIMLQNIELIDLALSLVKDDKLLILLSDAKSRLTEEDRGRVLQITS